MGGEWKRPQCLIRQHLHLTQLWMGLTHVCLSSISSEFKQYLNPLTSPPWGVTEAEQIKAWKPGVSNLRSKHYI